MSDTLQDRAEFPGGQRRRVSRPEAAPELVLRDFLSIPYRIQASTSEVSSGQWRRRAAYPELPGCVAEAATIEEALTRLEHRRIEIILAMLRSGTRPPLPRPPLRDSDPEGIAEQLGLREQVAPLLDHTASQIAGYHAVPHRPPPPQP